MEIKRIKIYKLIDCIQVDNEVYDFRVSYNDSPFIFVLCKLLPNSFLKIIDQILYDIFVLKISCKFFYKEFYKFHPQIKKLKVFFIKKTNYSNRPLFIVYLM